MSTVAKVIAEARTHIGYVESAGKDNKFGKWYGMNHNPWCAMFVSYCFNKAGAGKLVAASNAKGFASCGQGIKFFKRHNAWLPVAKAKAGDLAFFDWDHDGEQDHVALVVSNDPKTKTIHTIEGNTSDKSHSNGGTVQAKVRNYGVIMGVGRPAWAEKPSVTPTAPVKPVPKPAPAKPAPKPVAKAYKVKAGDSYWAIAEKHPVGKLSTNETMLLFQRLNGGKALHPGDTITIR